jgi:D-ribose pyranase
MKKTVLLHQGLSEAIAGIGHTDSIALVDAGYSIPRDAHRIDLAVRPGLPSLEDVLQTVLTELCVESFILAEEMAQTNAGLAAAVAQLLEGIVPGRVPQSEFKALVHDAKVVVRTGEYSPYGNVILVGGVPPAFFGDALGAG